MARPARSRPRSRRCATATTSTPRCPGVPALREAVLDHQRACYGLEPEDLLITFGATEAIAAALLGLCDPGDEVVVLEPYYDSYAACIGFAGARRRPVTLRPPDFALDPDALNAAISPRARVLLLNTPHNPTGRVLDRSELELIAAACVEHDLVCISDEVYEHLVYDVEHIPAATLPGMAERTLTISSVGKTFSFTGWKIGWCSGPAELVAATRKVKQFLTFAGGTPLQHAAAAALRLPASNIETLRDDLKARRDQLCAGLAAAGLRPLTPQGTYFINADVGADAVEFCSSLPERCGIVAIPTSAFYDDQDGGGDARALRLLQALRGDRGGRHPAGEPRLSNRARASPSESAACSRPRSWSRARTTTSCRSGRCSRSRPG